MTRTLMATALAAALPGVPLALAGEAETRQTRADTRSTPRIAGHGDFMLRARASGERVRVIVKLEVVVRRRTRLAVSTFPCRTGRCENGATGRVNVKPGVQRVRFTGLLPLLEETRDGEPTGRTCVFARARDVGVAGDSRDYPIRLRGHGRGASLCLDVPG